MRVAVRCWQRIHLEAEVRKDLRMGNKDAAALVGKRLPKGESRWGRDVAFDDRASTIMVVSRRG